MTIVPSYVRKEGVAEMSMSLTTAMNRALGEYGKDLIAVLEQSANLVEACEGANIDMNDVERRFLSDVPDVVFAGLKASLIAALQADRRVIVDWTAAYSHEMAVSDRPADDVIVLLRAPSPFASGATAE